MHAKLVVLGGANAPSEWELTGTEFLLGRSSACQLQLRVPGLSRTHARLERRADGWYLCDLGSKNGTAVNRARLLVDRRLAHGDTITIGKLNLRFVAADEDAPADGASHADEPRRGGAKSRPDQSELRNPNSAIPVVPPLRPATPDDGTSDIELLDETDEIAPADGAPGTATAPAAEPDWGLETPALDDEARNAERGTRPAPDDDARPLIFEAPRRMAPAPSRPPAEEQSDSRPPVAPAALLGERPDAAAPAPAGGVWRGVPLGAKALLSLLGVAVIALSVALAVSGNGDAPSPTPPVALSPRASGDAPADAAPPAAPAAAPMNYERLDLRGFAYRVQPLLERQCGICHEPRRYTRPVLARAEPGAPLSAAALEANLRALLPYLDGADPDRSAVSRAFQGRDGRAAHAPVPALPWHDAGLQRLHQWMRGEPLRNLPPEAAVSGPAEAEPLARIVLSGRESRDLDSDGSLLFHWRMAHSPEGAIVRVWDSERALFSFQADRPGRYLVALQVSDGTDDSLPAWHEVRVVPAPASSPRSPGAGSEAPSVPPSTGSGRAEEARPSTGSERTEEDRTSTGSGRTEEARPSTGAGQTGSAAAESVSAPAAAATTAPPPAADAPASATSAAEVSAPPPLSPLARRFARRAVGDLLGRRPLSAEFALQRTQGEEALAAALTGSREYAARWYDQACERLGLTGRYAPVSHELLEQLAGREVSFPEALRRLARLRNFRDAHADPADLARVVCGELLGLAPKRMPAEYRAAERMAGGTSTRVLGQKGTGPDELTALATALPELVQACAAREYRTLFSDGADRAALDAAGRDLVAAGEDLPGVLRRWLMSEPYRAALQTPRPAPPETFLRGLYCDLLDRPPTRREYDAALILFTTADAPERGRREAAGTALNNIDLALPTEVPDDAAGWLSQWTLRLLAREPTAEELARLTSAEPAPRPRELLQALLCAPEYAQY